MILLLISNQKILYGQEVKPVSDPSLLRIKVGVPCFFGIGTQYKYGKVVINRETAFPCARLKEDDELDLCSMLGMNAKLIWAKSIQCPVL